MLLLYLYLPHAVFRISLSLLASYSWPFNKTAIGKSSVTMKINKNKVLPSSSHFSLGKDTYASNYTDTGGLKTSTWFIPLYDDLPEKYLIKI